MREMTHAIFDSFWTNDDEQVPKIVTQFRDAYKRVGELLDSMPEVLEHAHNDIEAVLNPEGKQGRKAVFSSDNLFRALIVMGIEGLTFRETTIRIAESETLQNFCRLLKKSTIDHTLLCRAACAVSPETWEKSNRFFGIRMMHEGKINPEIIRADTTVTECNIHYPTDSSLLWDCYRVMENRIMKIRKVLSRKELTSIRFHVKKTKKLHLDIARFAKSKCKKRRRKVVEWKKTLTRRVKFTIEKIVPIVKNLLSSTNLFAAAIGAELNEKIPVMAQVVNVAERRLAGEKVPATEKMLSIFEPHTELIKRGRREKPTEFGHAFLLASCPEKFITDYCVFAQRPSDTTLIPTTLERHEETFGKKPKSAAFDMGFFPGADALEALRDDLENEVEYLAVPSRLRDLGDVMMSTYQKFRAGIEGTISCLKRAFRLSRCLFRGFKGFCRAIGCAVFCHNLIVMSRQPEPG